MSELKPVAEIVQREPFDDGSQNPCKALLWDGRNAEDDFPIGTKLYTIPADQVLVPRESLSIILDYIKGDCGHSQEEIFHAALSLQISLRAKA